MRRLALINRETGLDIDFERAELLTGAEDDGAGSMLCAVEEQSNLHLVYLRIIAYDGVHSERPSGPGKQGRQNLKCPH